MNTNIEKFSYARRTFIGVASATLIIAGLTTAVLAAGAHESGHGHDSKKEQSSGDHMPGGGPASGMMQGGGMMQGSGMQSGGGHGHSFDFGMPGKASEASRTINVVMKDNYFELKSIKVKAGETIRFKIVNKGTYLHEFGIGTAAMHAAHQKQMMTMMEHGMIGASKINHDKMKMDHGGKGGMPMMSHNDPNSVLLEPGKSGEIIWKFTKPMKLEFACNVPGHYQSGMMGRIKFKK